ncbi:Uncharacterized protein TCM_012248 [Theobroma cacao]|uniref:Uncharacterized protein n=1 Tax=Theobroma cacao TaxID=3641 RepID=A0A061G1K3_THECC|nr:Uncharacterized protein TCM_012248 [Theobroma cacao]
MRRKINKMATNKSKTTLTYKGKTSMVQGVWTSRDKPFLGAVTWVDLVAAGRFRLDGRNVSWTMPSMVKKWGEVEFASQHFAVAQSVMGN